LSTTSTSPARILHEAGECLLYQLPLTKSDKSTSRGSTDCWPSTASSGKHQPCSFESSTTETPKTPVSCPSENQG
jgi:hypothetical protein